MDEYHMKSILVLHMYSTSEECKGFVIECVNESQVVLSVALGGGWGGGEGYYATTTTNEHVHVSDDI